MIKKENEVFVTIIRNLCWGFSYGPILTTFVFLIKYKRYIILHRYVLQKLLYSMIKKIRDSALGDHPFKEFLYYFLVFSPSFSLLVLNNKSNSISPLITLII
jgi:hypothetical protein